MKTYSRRSLLSAIGLALPLGVAAEGSPITAGTIPILRLRPFEEAVREAFASHGGVTLRDAGPPCRRVEVGHSEQVQAGVQGCHNDRPFAGVPAGHLRIVRSGSEPGPIFCGARLYVSTVDIILTGGVSSGLPSRPLDFASLPPAPTFS